MKYRVQSQSESLKTAFLYVVIMVVVVFLEFIGLIKPLQNFYNQFLTPISVQTANLTYAFQRPLLFATKVFDATNHLSKLTKENTLLKAELTQLQSLQKENLELKALLGQVSITDNQKPVRLATIINYASPMIVTHDGQELKTGQLVLAQGVLIGLVDEVSGNQGTIQLLTSSRVQTILVKTESGEQGTLIGNSRRVIMTDVAIDVPLISGERVMTSGQNGIPRDILIGSVSELIDSPTAPILEYAVVQPVSFYELSVVEVR